MERTTIDYNLPVTLNELKNHLHITSDDFDDTLLLNLRSATAAAESFTSMELRMRVETVSVPFTKTFICPDDATINFVSVDGVSVSYEKVNNMVYVGVDKGEKMLYQLTFGYTDINCPEDIKMAILLSAARYFNNPVDSVEQLPKASTALLRRYKRYMI